MAQYFNEHEMLAECAEDLQLCRGCMYEDDPTLCLSMSDVTDCACPRREKIEKLFAELCDGLNKMVKEEWIFNDAEDGGNWGDRDGYATREEAIAAGKKVAELEGWDELFVARKEDVVPKVIINADQILAYSALILDDEYEVEPSFGQIFTDGISVKKRVELQQMLDEAAAQWLKTLVPIRFSIKICRDLERIKLPEEAG